MAPDDLHAGKLILTLLVPLAVILTFPRVRPGLRRWTLAGFAVLLGLGTEVHHCCGAGDPSTQLWLPWIGIALATLFVASQRVLLGVVVLGIAASIHLSNEFLELVHADGFTGNPAWVARWARDTAQYDLQWIQEAARDAEMQGKSPPPVGWLDRGAIDLRPTVEWPTAYDVVVHVRWHTFFTGLWGADRIRLRLWYPDERPALAPDRIVWRQG